MYRKKERELGIGRIFIFIIVVLDPRRKLLLHE